MAIAQQIPPDQDPSQSASLAAEESLLAALLQRNSNYDQVCTLLKPEHFAYRIHATVYAAIGALIDRGTAADQITLRQFLDGDPDLIESGGWPYIMQLSRSIVSLINCRDYAQTIREAWMKRETVRIAEEMLAVVRQPNFEMTLADQLRPYSEALEQLNAEAQPASGLQHISKLTGSYLDRLDKAKRFEPGQVLGITTGITDLDAFVGGLPRQKITLLAGATSMGKSLTAENVAKAAARAFYDAGDGSAPRHLNVAYFSLEVDADTLQSNWAASDTAVAATGHFRAGMNDDDFEKLVGWTQVAGSLNIWIDDSPDLSAQEIAQHCRVLSRQVPIDLIVVDYLQLMRLTARNSAERASELGDAGFLLRRLCRQLNAAGLFLSQVNDENENREGKRPELRDLAQSKMLAKHADIVMFVFREHYYLSKQVIEKGPREQINDYLSRKSDLETKLEASRNKVDYIIAKFRGGPTGTVTAWSNLATHQIESLDLHQGGLWDQP